jgi:F-type H+-transporting ATPase subunit delta
MGILANHVPSIEQLNPGLVEIIEESGGTKQFFRTLDRSNPTTTSLHYNIY